MKQVGSEPARFIRPMTVCMDALEAILAPSRSILLTIAPREGVTVEIARGFAPGEIALWEEMLEPLSCGRVPDPPSSFPDPTLLRDPILLSLPFVGERRVVLALFGVPEAPAGVRQGARGLAAAFIDEVGRAWTLERQLVSTLVSFQMTAEKKDLFNQGHSDRVSRWALRTARGMGLGARDQLDLHLAAFLHDIGKVGVVEAVLNKVAPLTTEEFQIVAMHPEIGENLIKPVPHLKEVAQAVRHHHERWDGKGYPDGISGRQIPVMARILAVCEAYDAMINDAPFHRTKTDAEARLELRREAGAQFDPEVVEVFVSLVG